jgi:hypothetical protein
VAEREEGEADHCGTDTRASRLGELFSDGAVSTADFHAKDWHEWLLAGEMEDCGEEAR